MPSNPAWNSELGMPLMRGGIPQTADAQWGCFPILFMRVQRVGSVPPVGQMDIGIKSRFVFLNQELWGTDRDMHKPADFRDYMRILYYYLGANVHDAMMRPTLALKAGLWSGETTIQVFGELVTEYGLPPGIHDASDWGNNSQVFASLTWRGGYATFGWHLFYMFDPADWNAKATFHLVDIHVSSNGGVSFTIHNGGWHNSSWGHQ